MNKKNSQVVIEQKLLPRNTKTQGPVSLGITTFVGEIILKYKSQASVGPSKTSRKGSITIPQVKKSPITAHAEIHNKTEGSEKRFQSTFVQHYSPSQERNYCNLKEGA